MFIYILKPLGPLHLTGNLVDDAGSIPFPRSDTIAAAIAISIEQLYGDCPEAIFQDALFAVSSAMPWSKVNANKEPTLFLPIRKDTIFPEIDKKYKRLAWVEQSFWDKMFDSNEFLLQLDNIDHFIYDEFLSSSSSEIQHTSVRQRVTVDRAGGESETFFFGESYFSELSIGDSCQSGFWIAAEFSDDEIQSKFESALRLLGDTGIGADRSSGRGCFQIIQH
ncbi:hypothetical protein DRQ33_01170, partial [bacterium]